MRIISVSVDLTWISCGMESGGVAVADNKIFHLWNTNSRPPFRKAAAEREIVTRRDNPFSYQLYFRALFSDEHLSYAKGC